MREPLTERFSWLSNEMTRLTTYSGMPAVDLVRELHEPEPVAELTFDAPREVRRIDRQAMPTDAGPGREPHEPVGLGGGRVDGRPDVDAELAGEHRELVDERDVDVAERVLEQLGEFGLRGGRDRNDLVDETSVELLDRDERVGADAGDHFGRVGEGVGAVAGVDALGRVADEEVDLAAQPARFEDGPEQLLGRARVRRRLEHHARARE